MKYRENLRKPKECTLNIAIYDSVHNILEFRNTNPIQEQKNSFKQKLKQFEWHTTVSYWRHGWRLGAY